MQFGDHAFAFAKPFLQLLISLLGLFRSLLLRSELGQESVAFELILLHGLRSRPLLTAGEQRYDPTAHHPHSQVVKRLSVRFEKRLRIHTADRVIPIFVRINP